MFLTENIKEDFYYNLTHFSTLNRTGSKTNERDCMIILNAFLKSHFALFGTLQYTPVGFDFQYPPNDKTRETLSIHVITLMITQALKQ